MKFIIETTRNYKMEYVHRVELILMFDSLSSDRSNIKGNDSIEG